MFNPGDVLVQKFGGSSMATPERIQRVAERVAEQAALGRPMALVVSAMGDTTDDLIALVKKISPDVDSREMDQLMATGEMISCSMMVTALQRLGVRAKSYNASNLGILTDDTFGSAEIKKFGKIAELAQFISSKGVAVVAGFQGINAAGDFTTLGRGGSDITAVALARELNQKVCEKFTDEDGIYSADPRIIPEAKKIWHLDYQEMEMLASYGNGILHPRSIAFARESSIRIHVRSSFTKEEGSIVGPYGNPEVPLKSMTCDKKQAVVRINGSQQEIDCSKPNQSQAGVSFLEIQQNHHSAGNIFCAGFRIAESFAALTWLWSEADRAQAEEVTYFGHLAVITLVGCGIKNDGELSKKISSLFKQASIPILLLEQTGLRLSVAVENEYLESAMKLLHTSLFLSPVKREIV